MEMAQENNDVNWGKVALVGGAVAAGAVLAAVSFPDALKSVISNSADGVSSAADFINEKVIGTTNRELLQQGVNTASTHLKEAYASVTEAAGNFSAPDKLSDALSKYSEAKTELASATAALKNGGTALAGLKGMALAGAVGAAAVTGGGLHCGIKYCTEGMGREETKALMNAANTNFAEREQIRAIQGMMKARMAAVSPDYAAAQAQGRA